MVEQLVLDLFAHDEDDTVETGCKGVAGREVHERFAGRPDRGKLLQAPEAAAMTGCEQDELHG